MARRRKRRTLKPRVPARVKRKKRERKGHGHQHPELIGLGLLAIGIFLGSVIWAGWNGGYVGLWIAEGLEAVIGGAAWGLPGALAIVGALMVTRSDLVDVRPFRTGLAVLAFGLMITLGQDEGGYIGSVLGGGLALALGGTGVAIVGVLTLLAGALRVIEGDAPTLKPQAPPVDVVNEFPELVSEGEHAPLLVEEHFEQEQATLFENGAAPAADYRLPDRDLLRCSKPGAGPDADHSARVAEALVQTLANFGVDATVIGQISGPRVTRYELQLAPGTKVSKVAGLKDDLSYALATTEIRILAPIP